MIVEDECKSSVIKKVTEIKDSHPEKWSKPKILFKEYGINLTQHDLGKNREGCYINNNIIIDPKTNHIERKQFTYYHEFLHHLIETDEQLKKRIDNLPGSQESNEKFIDRLCDLGAAEFLIPRHKVVKLFKEKGRLSIHDLEELYYENHASRTATLVQMTLCANHVCVGLVLRPTTKPDSSKKQQSFSIKENNSRALRVEVAFTSPSMEYQVGTGHNLKANHLFNDAYDRVEENVVAGETYIPFKSGNDSWSVRGEALRKGNQVFGLLHEGKPEFEKLDQQSLEFT